MLDAIEPHGRVSDSFPLASFDRGTSALSKWKLRIIARFSAFTLDLGLITLAFIQASALRFGTPFHHQALVVLSAVLPLYLFASLNWSAYSASVVTTERLGVQRTVSALGFSCFAVTLIAYLLKASDGYSRVLFSLGSTIALISVPFGRVMLARALGRAMDGNPMMQVMLVDRVPVGFTPGFQMIDAEAYGITPDINNPEMMTRLGVILEAADRVVVACPPESRAAWAQALKGVDVEAQLLTPELDRLGPLAISHHNGHVALSVSAGPMPFRDRLLKRLLDVMVVTLALPLLLPVLTLTALAVRLDSPGPILFAQRRVGRGSRVFKMYKFRSMRADRCDANASALTTREDDRVTRVGAFIRSTSIDELPQIFNVLLGDMSIVGPRPHALGATAEQRLYWDIDDRYWHRHATKPGLTGLAQIRGYRGSTDVRADLVNRLQSDLEYLRDWSLAGDIAIIASTFKVLVHRQAY